MAKGFREHPGRNVNLISFQPFYQCISVGKSSINWHIENAQETKKQLRTLMKLIYWKIWNNRADNCTPTLECFFKVFDKEYHMIEK